MRGIVIPQQWCPLPIFRNNLSTFERALAARYSQAHYKEQAANGKGKDPLKL